MKQVQALKASGKIRGFSTVLQPEGKASGYPMDQLTETGPKVRLKMDLERFCREIGWPLYQEQRFHVKRKWRFDFLIPGPKPCAIEYDGIFSKDAHRNGHQNQTGYVKDAQKCRAAAMQGITVLRYTAKDSAQVIDDLKKFFK